MDLMITLMGLMMCKWRCVGQAQEPKESIGQAVTHRSFHAQAPKLLYTRYFINSFEASFI